MLSTTTQSELSSTGFLTTSTLGLPPQITPFTPPPTVDCKQSVYCPFLSYLEVDISSDFLNQRCVAVNKLGKGDIGFEWDCFPKGYETLFYEYLYQYFDQGTREPPSRSTIAYPGTACPSDWTTACTSVVTFGGDTYPQAWCCPSSSWQCAITSGRYCTSVMTESTDIWMTWDPPFTDPTLGDLYTWTAAIESRPSESAPTVYRRVFPLHFTANSSDETTPDSSSSGTPPENSSHCEGPDGNCSDGDIPEFGLSTGVKAGIGAAAGVVVLGIFVASMLILRKRRKGKNSSGEATMPEDNSPHPATGYAAGDKPELEGSMVAQSRGVIPKAELDAGDGERLRQETNGPRVESGSRAGTVSPLGTLSPDPTGSDGIFPSPESRHKSVFEMSG
ncbi:hypothetical protein F4821DRAFT_223237 [Hypoxylon rubiginosum]|uniref:Uncharacterized protein n=1 Tax=Hypoxylon rubiginosum TaxID=110542 RepID=A0ACC0DK42_9PEZI|nr:hypothetical protein F4821DRAFT_223237 [Hypoxylon rubiginosum]